MGIRCKRPKLELEHDDGPDYEEGKKKVKNYKKKQHQHSKKKESDAGI